MKRKSPAQARKPKALGTTNLVIAATSRRLTATRTIRPGVMDQALPARDCRAYCINKRKNWGFLGRMGLGPSRSAFLRISSISILYCSGLCCSGIVHTIKSLQNRCRLLEVVLWTYYSRFSANTVGYPIGLP